MSFDFEQTKRKPIIQLQLAPMIDIFTLIIVFLIMGTTLSGTTITFPSGMKTPKSISKENIEASPPVIIAQDKVMIPILNKEYPLSVFMDQPEAEMNALKALVGEYIKAAPNESKIIVSNVNIITDAATPYKIVFNVVKVLRQAGFQSVLFLAEGEVGSTGEASK